ncbi:unnamed protein product [Ceratitis capitata]|uniref:(Mediterranean fruit fly) hypothetical protein n=1 Tax=Ceratitis capitata TaxID=7213 RepID=A0A811U1L3_CERCA|nr:unnamed protein product [Ceratitis capitata]
MQQCDNVIRMQIVATYEEETCEFVQPTTGTCFKRKDKKEHSEALRFPAENLPLCYQQTGYAIFYVGL